MHELVGLLLVLPAGVLLFCIALWFYWRDAEKLCAKLTGREGAHRGR